MIIQVLYEVLYFVRTWNKHARIQVLPWETRNYQKFLKAKHIHTLKTFVYYAWNNKVACKCHCERSYEKLFILPTMQPYLSWAMKDNFIFLSSDWPISFTHVKPVSRRAAQMFCMPQKTYMGMLHHSHPLNAWKNKSSWIPCCKIKQDVFTPFFIAVFIMTENNLWKRSAASSIANCSDCKWTDATATLCGGIKVY